MPEPQDSVRPDEIYVVLSGDRRNRGVDDSRFPIGARVFLQEPTAESIVQLFRESVQRFRLPRHLVTDQGSQFPAKCFRDALANAGVRERDGAIGKVGSIALIERFWRSLKHSLALKQLKPLVLQNASAIHYVRRRGRARGRRGVRCSSAPSVSDLSSSVIGHGCPPWCPGARPRKALSPEKFSIGTSGLRAANRVLSSARRRASEIIPSGPLLRIGHDRFVPGLRELKG